jgi:hypothetical protein
VAKGSARVRRGVRTKARLRAFFSTAADIPIEGYPRGLTARSDGMVKSQMVQKPRARAYTWEEGCLGCRTHSFGGILEHPVWEGGEFRP